MTGIAEVSRAIAATQQCQRSLVHQRAAWLACLEHLQVEAAKLRSSLGPLPAAISNVHSWRPDKLYGLRDPDRDQTERRNAIAGCRPDWSTMRMR